MNILLCCSAGMSTSLLVSKMRRSAAEQNLDHKIWAVPIDAVSREIIKADVLLLGPQVRYMYNELKKLADSNGIPVTVIDKGQYGRVNGKEVLLSAVQLYNDTKLDQS